MLKKVVIALEILLVIILLWVGYAFFKFKTNPKNETFVETASNIFPFGDFGSSPDLKLGSGGGAVGDTTPSPDSTLDGNTTDDPSLNTPSVIPRLRQITTVPTAGSIIVPREKEIIKDGKKTKITEYFIRYTDRATGHVSETKTDSLSVEKISNTTIPKVYEAYYTFGGDGFLARLLDDDGETIKTYFVSLVKNTGTSTDPANILSPKESSISFLPNNLREVSLSPDRLSLLSLSYGGSGGVIEAGSVTGKNKKTVYNGELREWLIEWVDAGRAILTTKPSGYVVGYSYFLNMVSGGFDKITGGILGLTIHAAPNTQFILVGEGGNTQNLSVYSTKDRSLRVTGLKTLPEKCTFAKKEKNTAYCLVPFILPEGVYPDSWYKGDISFSDTLWKINLENGETKLVANFRYPYNQEIDGVSPEVASNDAYITFINKKDLTLWGYTIEEQVATTTTKSTASSTAVLPR